MLTMIIEDVLNINWCCLKEGEPFSVLDNERLKSALGNQYQPYDWIEQNIASVFKSLVINHGFQNGNKRTGVIALNLLAYSINSEIKLNDRKLCELTYLIASEGGGAIPVDEIAEMLFETKTKDSFQTIEIDVAQFTKQYCLDHKWLIDELAK